MKRLRINMIDLAEAFELGGQDFAYYLDRETGEVLMVGSEAQHLLNQIYEAAGSAEPGAPVDLDGALERRGVGNWLKETVKTAHRIDRGFGSRYLQVPESDSFAGYADMKAFIESVPDRAFADRLWTAIQGKGAFHRFKDTLAAQPALEQRWFKFKEEQMRARMAEWLAAQEIEAEGVP